MNSPITVRTPDWLTGHSVRFKLVAGIVLLQAVLMTVFVVDMVERQLRYLREGSAEEAVGMARTAAVSSASWVLANDLRGLAEVVHSLGGFPGLRYAMVVEPGGRVLAHTDESRTGWHLVDSVSLDILTGPQELRRQLIGSMIDVAVPIQSGGDTVGWARVGIDQQGQVAASRQVARQGVLYTLVAIAIGSIFALLIGFRLTSRFNRLVRYSNDLREGRRVTPAGPATADEIGQLENAFTTMAATIWQREDDLRKASKAIELKGITDSLAEGVVVVDTEGVVVFANPAAKRLLLCREDEEVEGRLFDDILRLARPQGSISLLPPMEEGNTPSASCGSEDDALFVLPCARTLTVSYACTTLVDEAGRRRRIISFHDIGALKNAQREAMQSARLAGIGQLAAGIAHEINTPTQFIGDNLSFIGEALGDLSQGLVAGRALAESAAGQPDMAEAVARFNEAAPVEELDPLLDDLAAAVRETREGVGRIAQIVLSMKEFSHPGTAAKAATDINRALENTLVVSRNSWKHVAEMDCDFDPALPPVSCLAGDMNQVFLNLIINAAHAIEDSGKPSSGRIRVTTRRDGAWVEISVADTGNGVPQTIRDRIFDPFFTTKDVGQGTGQGLAICRDVVVSKHGGTITVGGEEGQGAVFIVRLPIDPGEKSVRSV
ncbi:MAG: hypothetical protein BWK76_07515 [Desulfobulbaceae bacterium A2]|nr:MAG: hypothetical protein BWK76_07515 [Desulfobulbaceae bacterium A2]